MNIQYCSDLHLEFRQNRDYLNTYPIEPVAPILLMAGDIVPIHVMETHGDFFDYLSYHWEAVYWVPGNHEYYRSDIHDIPEGRLIPVRKNVFLTNRKVIHLKNTDLICATLWSKIRPENEKHVQEGVTDFHLIKHGGMKLTASGFNDLHLEHFHFVETALQNSTAQRKIVISHHVPTLLNYPEPFKFSPVNDAFGVELFDFIEGSGTDYWIYGHHHTNIPEFTIGKTRLLTNQLGYVHQGQHHRYRNGAIAE